MSDTVEKIEDNRVVVISFTLSDVNGEVLDTSPADDPFVYLHGHGNVMSGLEQALAGQQVGAKFTVELPPEEAFGERVPDSERVLDADVFPEDMPLEEGLEFAVEDDDEIVQLWIKRVEGSQVVVDMNHPFAGRTVRFDGEVLRIREATEEELEHGHPHGLEGTEVHSH